MAHGTGGKAEPVALVEELLDEGLHGGRGAHLASSGHGNATVLKLPTSSFA